MIYDDDIRQLSSRFSDLNQGEERLAAVIRHLGKQFFRPDFFNFKTLGKLYQLPKIGV